MTEYKTLKELNVQSGDVVGNRYNIYVYDENAWTSTYKPGIWYGWNGGECPVHPKDELEIVDAHGVSAHGMAGGFNWNELRGAFMIITPYVEPRKPREVWMNYYDYGLGWNTYRTRYEADKNSGPSRIRCVKFVEQVEE